MCLGHQRTQSDSSDDNRLLVTITSHLITTTTATSSHLATVVIGWYRAGGTMCGARGTGTLFPLFAKVGRGGDNLQF